MTGYGTRVLRTGTTRSTGKLPACTSKIHYIPISVLRVFADGYVYACIHYVVVHIICFGSHHLNTGTGRHLPIITLPGTGIPVDRWA